MIKRLSVILLLFLLSMNVLADRSAVVATVTTETLSAEVTINGTTSQVTVTDHGGNTFTLSTPQDMDTISSPTFVGITVGSLAGYIKGIAGVLSASASIPNTDITGLGTLSTQNSDAVNVTGFKFVDGNQASGKYLASGADGTATWTTPSFSATSTVVNVADYGATGDGSDQTTEIALALAACGAGDTLYFPKGKYITTSTLTFTTRVNLVGDGMYSMLAMNGNNNLVHYDASGTPQIDGITIKNIYLLSNSTGADTSLLKLTNVHDSYFENIHLSGAKIMLHVLGSMRNTFNHIRSETSGVDSLITQSVPTYGLYMQRDVASSTSSNANVFNNCSFRQLGITYAAYIVDTNSEGGFKWYGGTPEGLAPAGSYSFYVVGVAQPFLISGIHAETTGDIYINGCFNGLIQSSIGAGINVTIVTSKNIVIDSCVITGLSVDYDSTGGCNNCRQGSGSWVINSPNWYGGCNLPPSGQSSMVGGRSNSMKNLCSGNLETWALGLPTDFELRGTPTLTQETTIKLFGSNSAKLVWGTGSQQGLEFTLPADVLAGFIAEAVNINNADYDWAPSAVSGEYYLTLAGGGDPSVPNPHTVIINGTARQSDTIGALGENRWGYGDNDTLGYSTIYVNITPDAGSGDPDSEALDFVKYVDYVTYVTSSAYFYSPASNKATAKIIKAEYRYGAGAPDTIVSGLDTVLPSDSWKKCICTFEIEPYVTNFKITFGMIGESAGDILYVDGIEVMTGHCVSDRYNDNNW